MVNQLWKRALPPTVQRFKLTKSRISQGIGTVVDLNLFPSQIFQDPSSVRYFVSTDCQQSTRKTSSFLDMTGLEEVKIGWSVYTICVESLFFCCPMLKNVELENVDKNAFKALNWNVTSSSIETLVIKSTQESTFEIIKHATKLKHLEILSPDGRGPSRSLCDPFGRDKNIPFKYGLFYRIEFVNFSFC